MGNGIGLGTVLAIVFTVLKLTGAIAWSWWWVLVPVWGPIALVVAVFLVWALIAGIVIAIPHVVSGIQKAQKRLAEQRKA